jgi:thioredoxin reductase
VPFLGLLETNAKDVVVNSFEPLNDIGGNSFDVVVIGGSYAGLSAAMSLGRCLRKVLVIDNGQPRNLTVKQANNLFGNDGMKPESLKKEVLKQLEKYKQYLNFHVGTVTEVSGEDSKFKVKTDKGQTVSAQKIIFATGATDPLPDIAGLREQWGKNAHHCPYCHGFESVSGKTVLISEGLSGAGMLGSLQHWCSDLTLCTNGFKDIPPQLSNLLTNAKATLNTDKIKRIVSKPNGDLVGIEFENGKTVPFDHIYISTRPQYRTEIAEKLGCRKDKSNRLETEDFMETNVKGVYAIGDISNKSVGQILWAAYSGMMTAVSINSGLIAAKFQR